VILFGLLLAQVDDVDCSFVEIGNAGLFGGTRLLLVAAIANGFGANGFGRANAENLRGTFEKRSSGLIHV
jgi:hypothetical protein